MGRRKIVGVCGVPECGQPLKANGWCSRHDDRARRTGGDPTPAPKLTTEERFFAKVDVPSTCWMWTGAVNAEGYGVFQTWPSGTVLAHRWSWELFHGPIPEGLHMDHLCHERRCVNPDHLDPVTNGENVRRSNRRRAKINGVRVYGSDPS
jgi:hypothetical protein